MAEIGYARVSTADQNPQLQRDALTAAGVERIYEDKATGANTDRPELTKVLEHLRTGDTLVVWKLDRLGRSLPDLIRVVTELADRGIDFRSLTEGIDTTTASGRLMFHIMGALAQFERDLIRERTRAGIEAARNSGKHMGRPSRVSALQRKTIRDNWDTSPVRDIAQTTGLSRATIYRERARMIEAGEWESAAAPI